MGAISEAVRKKWQDPIYRQKMLDRAGQVAGLPPRPRSDIRLPQVIHTPPLVTDHPSRPMASRRHYLSGHRTVCLVQCSP